MTFNNRIIIVCSTFPAHKIDPVPAFIRDQVIWLKKTYPKLHIDILAPHDRRSNTKTYSKHSHYDEYRFHYFWPFSLEQLAGRGIIPSLKQNPLNYLLIPFLFIGEFIALIKLTKKSQPAFIYAHWFTPQAVVASWVGSLTRTPFVFTTHAADAEVWHKVPFVGGWIVRATIRKALCFTAVSRRSMDKLTEFLPSNERQDIKTKSAIIPMGVDLPTLPARSKRISKKQTILFLGRLAEKKGVTYLLKAFADIKDIAINTDLIIAGDGQLLEELKQEAMALELEGRAHFTGYVSGREKSDLLESADIFVVPSIIAKSGDAEGLPVSLMEGLAYGKICIATNESGADNILTDTKDGFLIEQKNIGQLVQALQSSMTLKQKDRVIMQKAAQQTAKQFAWPTIVKQHMSLFLSQKRNN